jgi:hypothetical protein
MAFLSPEALDEVAQNTGPDKRYLGLSKLPDGKPTRIRILGEGITGFEAWTTNNKPIRWPLLPDELPANIRPDDNGNQSAKYFIAGIAWDYAEEMFRVVTITQKGVLDSINKHIRDEDYGDPSGYDFTITKTGSGLETKYSVMAKPPKPISASIKAAFADLDWDLTRLFDGKAPWDEPTKGGAADSDEDDD